MRLNLPDKNSILYLSTTDSKVDNVNIFTNSFLDNKGQFINCLNQIREGKIKIDHNNLSNESLFKINYLKLNL